MPDPRTPAFSFCEQAAAGPLSPWHIRRLTGQGQKLTGGIDTPPLCDEGKAKRPNGWDISVEITEHHLGHACKGCVAEYRALGKALREGR